MNGKKKGKRKRKKRGKDGKKGKKRKKEGRKERERQHTYKSTVTVQDKNKKEKNGIVCPQR